MDQYTVQNQDNISDVNIQCWGWKNLIAFHEISAISEELEEFRSWEEKNVFPYKKYELGDEEALDEDHNKHSIILPEVSDAF